MNKYNWVHSEIAHYTARLALCKRFWFEHYKGIEKLSEAEGLCLVYFTEEEFMGRLEEDSSDADIHTLLTTLLAHCRVSNMTIKSNYTHLLQPPSRGNRMSRTNIITPVCN